MVVILCPYNDCNHNYKTADVSEALVCKLLEIRVLSHTNTSSGSAKGPKLTRPIVDVSEDEETWTSPKGRWLGRHFEETPESQMMKQLPNCLNVLAWN
jgi:hypothetical protein